MPSKREQIKPAIVEALAEGGDARSVKSIGRVLEQRELSASASVIRAACEELCEAGTLENAGWGRKVRYRYVTAERRAQIKREERTLQLGRRLTAKLNELGYKSAQHRIPKLVLSVEDAERLMARAGIELQEG
jgi:DNA-binding transcriptional regulator PaaX